LQIRHTPRPELVSENCSYYAISLPSMGVNSISDQQDNRLCAEVASGSPTNTKEIDPEGLGLLREFFLLLDQWDREQQK
jgi:hypothetical protein